MSTTASRYFTAPVASDWRRPVLQPLAPPTPSSSPVAFKGLLAFTAIMMLAPQIAYPFLVPLRPALLAAAVSIGAYVLHRLIHRQPLVVPSRELAISVALLWWAVLTLPLSIWPTGSLEVLSELYIKTLLIFWLLGQVVDTPARLRTAAWCLTILAMPLALTGINQYATGQFLDTAVVTRIAGYEAPTTANPNDLALMLNILLPLTLALLIHADALWQRLVLLAMSAIMVCAVILTFSRSGFIALSTIGILFAYRLIRQGRLIPVAAVALTAVAAVPLLPGSYLQRLTTIVNTDADRTYSAQTRWSDMTTAMRVVANNPVVGAGLGMDILAMNQARGETWTAVHDVYLQYGIDLGLPGLTLYGLLAGSAIASAGAARRLAVTRGRRELAGMAEAVRISLIAFSVAAIFHPVAYHFYFYYLAGLAVAVARISRDVSPLPRLAPLAVHRTR